MSLSESDPRDATPVADSPWFRSTGFAASGLIAVLVLLVMNGRPINIDTAWYLVAIRKWLEGSPLYVDIFEVNPPLAFYLTAPGVLLADLLGTEVMDGMFLYLAILIGLALAWVWALALSSDLPPRSRAVLLAGAAAAMLIAPKFYGQREHLMVILAMPWFASMVLGRGQSGRKAAVRAGVAALGLCLKPHFLLIPACLTLTECRRNRSLRPAFSTSNVMIATMGMLYLAFVAIRHPAYFTQIVPVALDVYADYSFGAEAVLQAAQLWLVALFLVAALAGYRQGVRSVEPVVAAIVGALAAYFAQWNGFPYHLLPTLALMAFGFLWLAAQPQAGALLRLASAGGLLAIFAQTATFHKDHFAERLAPKLAEFPQPIRYMAFSTALDAAFPLVLTTGAEWTGRGPALWFLPAIVNGIEGGGCEPDRERCARLHEIEEIMRDMVMDDIGRNDPNVLVFPKHNLFLRDTGFDIRAYMERDARFRRWMTGFALVEDGPGYSLWVRR